MFWKLSTVNSCGDNVDVDLVAGRDIGILVLVGHRKLVDLLAGDIFLGVLPHDIAAGLEAFDVMAGDAYIYFPDVQVGIGGIAIIQRHADGLYGFIDIKHLAVFDAVRVGPAKAQYL